MIDAGRVRIGDRPAAKAAVDVDPDSVILVDAADHYVSRHYVSRGAHKLAGALADLGIRPRGRAVDAGASTGGFTQVLLEAGCDQVYAIDVGHDQLAPTIRSDPRVTVWERTNLRDLDLAHVDHRPVDLLVADVSFISLRLLIEPFGRVLHEGSNLLIMIKPQFEVGRAGLGKGGVVEDPKLRRAAVDGVLRTAEEQGWQTAGVVPSRLTGGSGNVECFALLCRPRHLC